MSSRALAPRAALDQGESDDAGEGDDAGGRPARRLGRGARWWIRARAALAGVLAAALALDVAELVAAFVDRAAAPVVAIGSAFIDRVSPWLKDFAVATFGTNDKLVLLLSMGVVIAILAALCGLLALRDRRLGAAAVVALGVVAAGAALMRASVGLLAAVPSVVGFALGVAALTVLVGALRGGATPARDESATGRRSFLVLASSTAVVAVLAGAGGRLIRGATQAVGSARSAIRLPRPSRAANALPAGADVGVDGVTPFVTDNGDFYRIDTALRVPQIDPSTWSLRVHGLVDREVELS